MKVDALMISEGPSIYYDSDFRSVLEAHMGFLREHSTTLNLVLDPGKLYRYEYDLWGFLSELKISAHLHWIVMRLNKMTSPMQFGPKNETLLIPDQGLLERIRQAHMSTRKVT